MVETVVSNTLECINPEGREGGYSIVLRYLIMEKATERFGGSEKAFEMVNKIFSIGGAFDKAVELSFELKREDKGFGQLQVGIQLVRPVTMEFIPFHTGKRVNGLSSDTFWGFAVGWYRYTLLWEEAIKLFWEGNMDKCNYIRQEIDNLKNIIQRAAGGSLFDRNLGVIIRRLLGSDVLIPEYMNLSPDLALISELSSQSQLSFV